MMDETSISDQVFFTLQGTWTGEGRGGYPTITSFDYRETLAFTRRDDKSMAYEQRTQKRYDGQIEWHAPIGRMASSAFLKMVN